MSWSEGITSMTPCGSAALMRPMPRAMAGAVSRRTGSEMMLSTGISWAWRRTSASCRWLVRIKMFCLGTSPSSLSIAWRRRVPSPNMFRSCLGRWSRERGQKRVPLPPARIRAYWFMAVSQEWGFKRVRERRNGVFYGSSPAEQLPCPGRKSPATTCPSHEFPRS